MKKLPTKDKDGKMYIPKKQFERLLKEGNFPAKEVKEIYHPIEHIEEIGSK